MSLPSVSSRRSEFEREAAEFEPLAGLRVAAWRHALRAAKHGPDARQQLARVEGLGHVVVGAYFKPDDAVHLLGNGGEKDDGRRGRFAQIFAQRKPVLSRHHDVENDQVESACLELPPGLAGVRCHRHAHAVLGEELGQEIADFLVIVYDENVMRGFHWPLPWPIMQALFIQRSVNL